MSIGKEPDEIDAEQPDTNDVADALGFGDLEAGDADSATGALEDADLDDEVEGVLQAVVAELGETKRELADTQRDLDRTREELADVKDEQQSATETRQDLAKRTTDAVDAAENAEDIAKTAASSAEQAKSIAETGETAFDREDPEGLPAGVEPSSSTLDFYANCRQHRVKKHLVDTGTPYRNRFRAVCLAKRAEEFATMRTNGTGVFWTRDDVEQGLTAILGEEPHYETVTRVWDAMVYLGGSDIEETDRSISSKQDSTEILSMDRDTADGLLESRYHHLELLNADGEVAGVTPVVIGDEAAEV